MPIIISKPGVSGGGGGPLPDHQHTTAGDGGDTIQATNYVRGVQLIGGEDGVTSGTLRLYDALTLGRSILLSVPAGGFTVSRNLALPNINGTFFVAGNAANPATVAGTMSLVNMPGQMANIASRIMAKTVPAGMYMVNMYMECSAVGAVGSNVVATIAWTDSVGAKTFNLTLDLTSTLNKAQTTVPVYINASGDITWSTIRTTGGTYAVRLRTSFMGA